MSDVDILSDPERRAALYKLELLDSLPEEAFDRFTRMASQMLGVPVALVSLLDYDRQFFKSAVGLSEPWASARGTALSHSLCQYPVVSGEPLIIDDTRVNPLVQRSLAIPDLGVVAYAGIPLITASGHALGSFCAIDHQPRHWTELEITILKDIAASVVAELELRAKTIELQNSNYLLKVARNQLELRVEQRTTELRQANESLVSYSEAQHLTEDQLRSSESRLRAVMESATDAIVLADDQGIIIFWNPAAQRMFQYEAHEALGQLLTMIMPERYRQLHTRGMQRVSTSGVSRLAGQVLELEGLRKDTTEFPIELSIALWWEGSQIRFSSIIRDITARKQIEAELRRSESDYRGVFEHAHDAIIIFDPLSQIVLEANQCACEIYGFSRDEFLGMSLQRISKRDVQSVSIIERIVAGESAAKFETIQFRKDGTEMFLEVNATLVQYHNRPAILSLNRDITERKVFEAQLTYQASHDHLTNLPNRTFFMERLNEALNNAHAANTMLAVLFIDLDRFKLINESLGHYVGDTLLITMARRFEQYVRPIDVVARIGGDEFVVLLNDLANLEEAIAIAHRLTHSAMKQALLTVAGRNVYATISIGVATNAPGMHTAEELLRDADNALTRAKVKGKARYEVFDVSMRRQALERLELEQDLRQALVRNEFVVYYQPVMALDDNSIVKAEALLRWRHPERGLVAPAGFIPLAEETELILPIGQWVLEQACAQAQAWNQAHIFAKPITINVNLSGRQFQDVGLVQKVAHVLSTTKLPAKYLSLEITESIAMDDPAFTATTLIELKQLGVQIAIDDFGTGYSSLNYLKRFSLDTLKIDKSFVAGLPHNSQDTAIVQTVIMLAQTLGMYVIAEGIEHAAQCEALRRLGCELGQGYYFAQPLLPSDLSKRYGTPVS